MSGQQHAPAAFYPRERPGTHCTGGWVVPRADLDRCGKSRPPPGFDPWTVQHVASRHTDWATRPTYLIIAMHKFDSKRLIKMNMLKSGKADSEWDSIYLFPLDASSLDKRLPPTLPRSAIYSWITISVSSLHIWQGRTSCNKRMKQQTSLDIMSVTCEVL